MELFRTNYSILSTASVNATKFTNNVISGRSNQIWLDLPLLKNMQR